MLAGETPKCSASTDDCLKKMVQKYQQTGWLGIEKEKESPAFIDFGFQKPGQNFHAIPPLPAL